MNCYITYSNTALFAVASKLQALIPAKSKCFVPPFGSDPKLSKAIKSAISKADFVIILAACGDATPVFKSEVSYIQETRKLCFWPKATGGFVELLLLQRAVQELRSRAENQNLNSKALVGVALIATGLMELETQ